MSARAASRQLHALANADIAEHSSRFFRTGPGEYGEGDRFLGIRVPQVRKLIREYRQAPVTMVRPLLRSKWHEERLFAALLMNEWCKRADVERHERIVTLYLSERAGINNWDIVDGSAPGVLGRWLLQRDRAVLDELTASARLWDRRIAMLATFHFIDHGDFRSTLALAERALSDPEDLMHKATGWMLREIGKHDLQTLRTYLRRHHTRMPRTMLRYAIEKLAPDERDRWMKLPAR